MMEFEGGDLGELEFSEKSAEDGAKKPDPPPPAPAAPPPPPPKPPGPPPMPPPPGPYTEDHLDPAYRMYNPRSVEFKNARTWTMNYDNYSDNYGDFYYSHHPVRIKGPTSGSDPQTMMGPPPPRYQALPPPGYNYGPPEYQRFGLPAPNHHYGQQRHGFPPPDHHHGPQRLSLPPPEHNHGPPRYGPEFFQHPGSGGNYYNNYYGDGGFFGDENPSACMIM